jgi:hypothetical protein
VIVLNDSPFERGQIIATLSAGATVSKVMSVYTNHGKTTNAKRNGVQIIIELLQQR